MHRNWMISIVVTAILAACSPALGEDPYLLDWVTQYGSAGDDSPYDIVVSSSRISYVAGDTNGDLGAANKGGYDAFISQVGPTGTRGWTHQDGTPQDEDCYGLAQYANQNLVISGSTGGDFGGVNQGDVDGYVARVDLSGNAVWTKQFGTPEKDTARSVDVYGNDIYLSGGTYGPLVGGTNHGGCDAVLAQYYYDTGSWTWRTQPGGTLTDYFADVCYDSTTDHVLVAGYTNTDLYGSPGGGRDIILACYANGVFQWGRQRGGTGQEDAKAIGVDADGNIYLAGNIEDGPYGGTDIFLLKYDSEGDFQSWQVQGTPENDYCWNLTVDGEGDVFVCGYTYGNLHGNVNQGGLDAFVTKFYGPYQNLHWTRQFGTPSNDRATGVATDSDGNLYVCGYTTGDLAAANAGGSDIFVAQYDIPEPASMMFLTIGGLLLAARRRKM